MDKMLKLGKPSIIEILMPDAKKAFIYVILLMIIPIFAQTNPQNINNDLNENNIEDKNFVIKIGIFYLFKKGNENLELIYPELIIPFELLFFYMMSTAISYETNRDNDFI